jgi:hypothetical protein
VKGYRSFTAIASVTEEASRKQAIGLAPMAATKMASKAEVATLGSFTVAHALVIAFEVECKVIASESLSCFIQ